MKKGRHRRYEEARSLKRSRDGENIESLMDRLEDDPFDFEVREADNEFTLAMGACIGVVLAVCTGLLVNLVRTNPNKAKKILLSFIRTRPVVCKQYVVCVIMFK